MDEVMDRADIVIENTDTLDAYRERIRAILDGDLDQIADSEYVDPRDSADAPVPADHDTPGGDGR